MLARPTPIVMHKWRCMLLQLFGAEISGRCYVYPSARVWAPWNLQMESGSCIADDVDCYNVAKVTLHKAATVSQRSFLCTASHDFDDPRFPLIGGDIRIRSDAWVAAEAFVGPGVTVGDRAVVLARSVVVRDTPAHVVVGGNPAKPIRRRAALQQEETIQK